jgi:hypothetical protein
VLSKIIIAKANGKFQEQTDLQGISTKHDPKTVGEDLMFLVQSTVM